MHDLTYCQPALAVAAFDFLYIWSAVARCAQLLSAARLQIELPVAHPGLFSRTMECQLDGAR